MKTSVALCTYNGEHYLFAQLESIAFQTKQIDEMVICDDCSTDNTMEVIRYFKERSLIPIIVKENAENLGYTKNFEQAISLCSGDIIFLSDQDDIWMPDKVSVMCDYFQEHPEISFIFTNALLINTIGVNSYDKTLFDFIGWNRQTKKLFDEGHGYEVLAISGRVTGATTAIRASFVPYCIPFPAVSILAVHDEIIAVTAMLHNKIAYIEKCLIKYRIHYKQSVGLGMLMKYSPERWELARDILTWHQELIEPHEAGKREKLLFVYRRFRVLREPFGIFKPVTFLIKGFYKKYYPEKNVSVFFRDLRCILVRRVWRIKNVVR